MDERKDRDGAQPPTPRQLFLIFYLFLKLYCIRILQKESEQRWKHGGLTPGMFSTQAKKYTTDHSLDKSIGVLWLGCV